MLDKSPREWAEHLLDNIATATQRRELLTSDLAEDKGLTDAILDNAENLFALARRDGGEGEAQPVAWLRPNPDGGWLWSMGAKRPNHADAEPVFAHPAPASAPGDGEQLAKALWDARRVIRAEDSEDDDGPWPPTAGAFGWQEDDAEWERDRCIRSATMALAALRQPDTAGE